MQGTSIADERSIPTVTSDLCAGEDHTYTLREDGAIVCWGDNSWQQLAAPAGVFAALAVGDDHSCALSEAGRVVCWGFEQRGQLWPPEGLEAAQISAGYDSVCALTAVGGGYAVGARWKSRRRRRRRWGLRWWIWGTSMGAG